MLSQGMRIDDVSNSGIMDSLNKNKDARRKFQSELVRIWFNPDKLAPEQTIGLQGSWKTVARAVENATRAIMNEYMGKYVL